MSEEILEDLEETTEETTEETIEIPRRVNPFCVISLDTIGDYGIRDIQTNGSWSVNPYPDTYVIVPDDLVPSILLTKGFCNIELNEDGSEIVSFTATEIPEIPEPEPEPTLEAKVTQLEETITSQNATIEAQAEEIALLNETLLGVLMG